MRRFFRVFLFVFIGFILFSIGLNIYVQQNKDEITARLIQEVNKNIKGEIKIEPENVSLTIFKDFPFVSLNLQDISIDGNGDQTQDLLNADHVFLRFDLAEFLQKKYKLLDVAIEGGAIFLNIDKDGIRNFDVIKVDTSSAREFDYANSTISLKECKVHYSNYYPNLKHPKQLVDFDAEDLLLKLNKDDSLFVFEYDLDGTSRVIQVKKDKYAENVDVEIEGRLLFDLNENSVELFNNEIKSGGLNYKANGSVEFAGKYPRLNLDLRSTKSTSTTVVFKVLNELNLVDLSKVGLTGKVDADIKITGILASWKQPLLNVDFTLSNGAYYLPDEQTLDNVSFKGLYSNANTNGSLKLDSLSFKFKNNGVKGNLLINDFKHPIITSELAGKLDLDILNSYTIDGQVNKGYLKANELFVKVQFNDFNELNMEWMDFRSRFEIQELSGTLGDVKFDNLYTDVIASNKAFIINEFNGRMNTSTFSFNGTLFNLYQFAFDKFNNPKAFNKLNLTGELNTDQIIVEDFLAGSTSSGLELPDIINFNINLNTDQFKYRKVDIRTLQAKLKKENSYVSFSKCSFEGFGGRMNLNGQMHQFENEDFYLSMNVDAKDLDINQLFYQMEDFSQDAISYTNLKGNISSKSKLKLSFTPKFEIDMDDLMFNGSISVTEGELLDYKPLLAMSKYISVEELKQIKFSDLSNDIEIKRRTVSIPRMTIQSSALDLLISGTHTFENDMDYSIRMKLSSLLSKKKRLKKDDNYEFNEKGEGSLYLKVTGNVEDPIIKYDRKAVRAQINADVKEEKETLKKVMRTEFTREKNVREVKDEAIKSNEIEFIDFDDDSDDE